MSLSGVAVPTFVRLLGSLSGFLDKAATHAEAKKIDPAVLLGTRLFPDMFPLARQVQLASDFAKGTTARLAGAEPPRFADEDKTFLGRRYVDVGDLAACLAYLEDWRETNVH
jgi:uncharacterized protein